MKLAWENLDLEIAPQAMGRVRCEPGWRLDWGWSHRLQDFDLWFVWAGRGEMRLTRGRTLELRPGVCLWMRPEGLYQAQQDPADRLGVSYVHFDLHDRRLGATRPEALPPEVHEFSDVGYADAVLRRVVALARGDGQRSPMPTASRKRRSKSPLEPERQTSPGLWVAQQLLRGLLMDMDAGAAVWPSSDGSPRAGTPRHHYELVMQTASRIREDPGHAPGIAQLAKRAGYSADHFARIFKQVLGQTPRSFIIHARVDRARQLLLESSLTITQIADALGYESVYFFSSQFKRTTGRSPSAYRRCENTSMRNEFPRR